MNTTITPEEYTEKEVLRSIIKYEFALLGGQ